MEKALQRLGDDLMAARREVDGLLEEHVRPGERVAEWRQGIELRHGEVVQRPGETIAGRVADELPSGLRHRFPQVSEIGVVHLEPRGHEDDRRSCPRG